MRRSVEIDAMLDPTEIVVDNNQRPTQRRQLAGISRLGTLEALALAGSTRRTQLAAH
jgi:hypothetical protein